jgi:phosphate starvation-inducible membrane PsiE
MDQNTAQTIVKRTLLGLSIAVGLAAAYFLIRAIAHWVGAAKWSDLPDLSQHDFEWLVLMFLFFIWMKDTDVKVECKCEKHKGN